MQEYYLGVDGGGTKCRMRLADADLNIVAEAAIEKPSNLQVRQGDAAYESITELTQIVFSKAGLTLDGSISVSACFGMAGGRLAAARDAFEARDFSFTNLKVHDDIDIARAGAHEGEDGAVLIIGTGSAGLGVMDTQRHQCGGWGFHIGDDMAGAILGRELLRKSLQAFEGLIAKTPLTEAVMAKFENNADNLMAWSFENPKIGRPARPADYGEFVPLVFDFYEQGDDLAKELMDFELASISQYVTWFQDRGAKSIAIVGGLGQRLLPQLQTRFGNQIVLPKAEPLQGAVILARQLFGKPSRF